MDSCLTKKKSREHHPKGRRVKMLMAGGMQSILRRLGNPKKRKYRRKTMPTLSTQGPTRIMRVNLRRGGMLLKTTEVK